MKIILMFKEIEGKYYMGTITEINLHPESKEQFLSGIEALLEALLRNRGEFALRRIKNGLEIELKGDLTQVMTQVAELNKIIRQLLLVAVERLGSPFGDRYYNS